MLTTSPAVVNGAPPAGVMWRIGQIATRDGVSDAAVSKSVKRLVDQHELQVERDGRGRVVAVNLAHYDELKGRFADPSKAQKPRSLDGEVAASYDKALAEKTTYDAERSRLQLAKMAGDLLERDKYEQALDEAGLRIGRTVEQLGSQVDDLASAYESGGLQALRIKLRDLVHAARVQIADILDQVE